MNKFYLILTVLVSSLLLFSCNKDESTPTQNSTTGTIQGQVTNVTGDTVIVGAIVTTSPATSSVSTNTQGNYSIPNVTASQYTVMASKGGYNPGSVTISVIAGQTTTANIHLSYLAGNNPPNVPAIVSPPDGSTNQPTTVTLGWTCSDPDGDPLTYDVYFGKLTPPSALVSSNQSATSLIRFGLDTSSTYYWKIVAKDNRGGSTAGNIWSFITRHDTIPTQGLIGYYPFNGNANDESGNGHNGIPIGGATLTTDRFGNANKAYSLNGVNGYVDVRDTLTLYSASKTMALWVYPRSSRRTIIVGKSNYVDASNTQFVLATDNNNFRWQIKRNSGCDPVTGWYICNSSVSPVVLQWQFIVVVWNGNKMQIFVDGVLKNENLNVPSGGIDQCIGGSLRFGIWWSGDPAPFYGNIDDVRIYNRALSDSEIYQLYHDDGW